MALKIYLHFDGPPQYSKVLKVNPDPPCTAFGALEAFAEAYCRRHPLEDRIEASLLALRPLDGPQLLADTVLPVSTTSGADYVVFRHKEAFGKSKASPSTEGDTEAKAGKAARISEPALQASCGKCVEDVPRQSGQKANAGLQIGKAYTQPAILQPFLEKAAAAESRQHFKMAASLYEQILHRSPKDQQVLTRLIKLLIRVNRPDKGLAPARHAVNCFPQDPLLRQYHADCLRLSGQKEDAIREYGYAISLAEQSASTEIFLNCKVSLAGMLMCMEGVDQDKAMDLTSEVLELREGHPGALMQLAMMQKQKGKIREATNSLIRLLIRDKDNSCLKFQLAQCLKSQEGVVDWIGSLPDNEMKGEALAFLATSVKDHGAVPTCIKLFQMAVEYSPSKPSYVLNLMHAYELLQEYSAAIDTAVNLFRLTRLELGGGFKFSAAAEALRGLPRLTMKGEGSSKEWLEFEAWRPPASACFPTQSDCELAAQISSAASNPDASLPSSQVHYGTEELDALAVLLTAVKVLYLGGAISRADQLVRIIEPARQASSRPLHTTLIRNEAAYFSCVAQLFKHYPPPPTPSDIKPIFLCGDSHTLSGAWHCLTYQGETRLLVPLLVTGCKIWHLRTAGCFFPKMAWLNTLQSLQNGSQLVFMFGEIDCREGLLLAVEKLKYDSLEEAMAVLIDIYASTLLDLVESRGFEIFVHPVPSVLNETRHVVRPFNKALQAKVQELAKMPAVKGKLHWLNLFDDLLTPDGLRLKPTLHLDGTHMNPFYVELIEKALQQC